MKSDAADWLMQRTRELVCDHAREQLESDQVHLAGLGMENPLLDRMLELDDVEMLRELAAVSASPPIEEEE